MTVTALAGEDFIEDASRKSKLQAIRDSRACEEGRVVSFDFASIRSRMGERWPARRPQVWSHVERALDRNGGPGAMHHRLDDTRFLLAFPHLNGPAAQAAGLHLMGEILSHFLGEVSEADQIMRVVLSASDAEMLIDGRVAEPPRTFAAPAAPRPVLGEWQPPNGAAIVSIDGERFRLTAAVEDVVELKTGAVIARRLATRISRGCPEEVLTAKTLAALPTNSILAIEMQVLDALAGVMRRERGPLLIAPLSILAFGGVRARLATLQRLHGFSPEDRARLSIELTGVDGGTPITHIKEALSLLKPVCRLVICRALPAHSCLAALREAGPRALSVNTQEFGLTGDRLSAGLMMFLDAAKGLPGLRLATGLESAAQLTFCTVAGYTHATLARREEPAASE